MSSVKKKLAKISDWGLILAIGALYAMLQFFTFLRIYSQHKLDGYEIDLWMMLQDRVIALLIGILFVSIIVKTTRRFLLKNQSWPKIISIHLVFAILTSLVWYTCFIGIAMLFCKGEDCKQEGTQFIYWYLMNLDKLVLLYLFTVSLTYTYFYVQLDSINKIHQSQIKNQLLQTRLMMLKSQLHPHFLFNTLNSITSLIDLDGKRAKTMIADLGDLLRYVLDHKDRQIVSLDEELQLLAKYVDIEKTRYAEDLEIAWQVDPDLSEAQIPSMLLQPLVENAIQHGFSSNHSQLKINIALLKNGNDIMTIEIKDNGKGFEKEKADHIFELGTGLKNTYERLKSIYGNRFQFFVENLNPGVINRIEIPLRSN
ncbi:MAG: hypothetical protein DHS20C18_43240 [Saprospiraceae bacterium]|nr:MAG: hypothetical protein DHS20C18_43240 [Saprospiraceae bacterium]